VEAFEKLIEGDNKDNIIDWITSKDMIVVIKDILTPELDESEDIYHGVDVNVAIASAITASSRVLMTGFKNNPDYNLYYSDTDSIVIDKPLDPELVGPELGALKLEHTIKRAIFLAPKVYGFITTDNQELIKIKGLTKDKIAEMHIDDLERLLVKDTSKALSHRKFHRQLTAGYISKHQLVYTLKVTSNKRKAVYNENGIFIDTQPQSSHFTLHEKKKIVNFLADAPSLRLRLWLRPRGRRRSPRPRSEGGARARATATHKRLEERRSPRSQCF
jgi:hypothetical protein